MICPNCHTINDASSVLCVKCGYDLLSDPVDSEDLAIENDYDSFGSATTLDLTALNFNDDSFSLLEARSYKEASNTSALDLPEEEDVSNADTIPLRGEPEVEDDIVEESLTHVETKVPNERYFEEEMDESFSRYNPELLASYAEKSKPGDLSATLEMPAISADLAEHAQSYIADDADPTKPRRRWVKWLLLTILFIVIAAAAVWGTYALQLWGGRVVPDVIGDSEVDAKYILEERGFAVSVEEEITDGVEGVVLQTDPESGVRVDEGSTVKLTISKGRIIPDVKGKPLEEAKKLLADAGYVNVAVETQKSNESANTVLSVEPQALTRANSNSRVLLKVSEPYTVPDIKGMSEEKAVRTLEDAGYAVEVAYDYTDDIEEGTAVSTDPAAGESLKSGKNVVLKVARSRSTELMDITRNYFKIGGRVQMDNETYEVGSVDAVTYEGNNTCKFTVSMRQVQTVTWFGGDTETRYGENTAYYGSMIFNDSNEIVAIQPEMRML